MGFNVRRGYAYVSWGRFVWLQKFRSTKLLTTYNKIIIMDSKNFFLSDIFDAIYFVLYQAA